MLGRIHYGVRLDMKPRETYHEGVRDRDKMEGNDGTNEEAVAVVQVRDKTTHGGGSSSTEEERPSSALDTGRREQLTLKWCFSSWRERKAGLSSVSRGGKTSPLGTTDASS